MAHAETWKLKSPNLIGVFYFRNLLFRFFFGIDKEFLDEEREAKRTTNSLRDDHEDTINADAVHHPGDVSRETQRHKKFG